jgi:hypothetical protein
MRRDISVLVTITIFLIGVKGYCQQWYYGELHGHTNISDGQGTPRQYFGYAKNTSGLNFTAITDHDDAIASSEWDSTKIAANDSNSSSFVALIGYEWSRDEARFPGSNYAHLCVYYPGSNPGLYSCNNIDYNTPIKLYTAISSEGGICHSAHPDLSINSYKYVTKWEIPDTMMNNAVLTNVEVTAYSGDRFEYYGNPYPSGGQIDGYALQKALQKGYYVGMIGSSDTHEGQAGNRGLTAVYSDSLTRSAIIRGLKKRHTFAVSKQNASKGRISLDFKVNDCLMGEICVKDTVPKIYFSTTGTSNIARLHVARITSNAVDTTSKAYTPGATPYSNTVYDDAFTDTACYYLKVIENGDTTAWSSPVWVFRDTLKQAVTRWSGIVNVYNDVVVPSGNKLVIEPGTIVRFKLRDYAHAGVDTHRCELIVHGTLVAKGTTGDSIYFTSDTTAPAANQWYGIVLKAGSTDSLQYCSIRHSYAGVTCDSGSGGSGDARVYMSICRFRNHQEAGIVCRSDSGKFYNNRIDSCGNYGIRFSGQGGWAGSNIIGSGNAYGIYISSNKGQVTIDENTISGCTNYGIYMTDVDTMVYVSSNQVSDCEQGGIGCGAECKAQIGVNHIYSNGQVGLLCTGSNCYPRVASNDIYSNPVGIKASGGGRPNMNNGNNCVTDNSQYHVQNLNDELGVNAENNWWGANPPDGDKFSDMVDYDPWLEEPPVPPERSAGKRVLADADRGNPPYAFELATWPNPFSRDVELRCQVPARSQVHLAVYNIAGALITTLIDEECPQGVFSVHWNGRNREGSRLANGVYIFHLVAKSPNGLAATRTKRILLVK